MGNRELKLFVWTNVLANWTPGIIFTLAENVEQAREVINRDKEDWQYIEKIYVCWRGEVKWETEILEMT